MFLLGTKKINGAAWLSLPLAPANVFLQIVVPCLGSTALQLLTSVQEMLHEQFFLSLVILSS